MPEPMPVRLWVYRARVTAVIDGDTLEVFKDAGNDQYSAERLRLLGVDTPELRRPTRPAGLAAKAFVVSWLAEAGTGEWPVRIETVKADSFGRYLCWLWRASDGRSLNEDLLAAGQAVPFDG